MDSKKCIAIHSFTPNASDKLETKLKDEYDKVKNAEYPIHITTMRDKMKYVFQSHGIQLTDPRIVDFIDFVKELEKEKKDISYELFKEILKPMYYLFTKISHNQLTIPSCQGFKEKVQKIYDHYKPRKFKGSFPKNLPMLCKADPDNFAVSICTVDGQIFNFGDTEQTVTMQSISKVINYLIALEQHGEEVVSKYVGAESSGQAFNSLELNNGKPFNPLINSGALACMNLLYKDLDNDRKYERYSQVVKALIGGRKVHYNNEAYLSEFARADRNKSLLHMLKETGIID